MMYLYAITDASREDLPDLCGLEEAPLLKVVYRQTSAVASKVAANGVRSPVPTQTALWQHEAVVEALMGSHTVLPVRFGTLLDDEAALRCVLASHYSGFVENLERVRGRVELSLQVLWDGVDKFCAKPADKKVAHRSAASGLEYMHSLLETEKRLHESQRIAEALAANLHSRLDHLSAASTHRVLVTPNLLLRGAFLVDCEQVAAFSQEVNHLKGSYPHISFLCTGPWPPYSFVTAGKVQG